MFDSTKNLVKYGYNQLAKRNLTSRFVFEDWKHLKNLQVVLKPGSRILDVGCGSGVPITKFLSDSGYNVTGVDISEEQINKAKINVPTAEFLLMDMEDLSFPDDSFDTIVSFYSIIHLPKVAHEKLIIKFFDLLRPGGHLMITMGIKNYEEIRDEYEDIKLFWSSFDKSQNVEMFRVNRFQLIYHESHIAGGEEHVIVFARKPN